MDLNIEFIVYMTTSGVAIELQAPTTREAVKMAVEQEAAAGRPDAKVIAVSWKDEELQQFIPVGKELLEGTPGTTLFTGIAWDLETDD